MKRQVSVNCKSMANWGYRPKECTFVFLASPTSRKEYCDGCQPERVKRHNIFGTIKRTSVDVEPETFVDKDGHLGYTRLCGDCGVRYVPTLRGNRYCHTCSMKPKRIKQREYRANRDFVESNDNSLELLNARKPKNLVIPPTQLQNATPERLTRLVNKILSKPHYYKIGVNAR